MNSGAYRAKVALEDQLQDKSIAVEDDQRLPDNRCYPPPRARHRLRKDDHEYKFYYSSRTDKASNALKL